MHRPEDGRRLHVSSYSEARLVREMTWLVFGVTLVVLSVSEIL